MRASHPKRKGSFSPAVLPLGLWSLAFIVVPLCYIITISFFTRGEYFGVVADFTLTQYANMAASSYIQVFITTFIVATLTTLITLMISYPFAYFTAKLKERYRSLVLLLLIVPFWLNSVVRLNGWIILLRSNGVVNQFLQAIGLIDQPLKLLYNLGATLLGMVYALCPFMILAIYNSVEKMDWSLVEAARDLGASPRKAFLQITLPLTKPGIIAGCILVFVPSTGLFYISDLLGGAKTILLGNLIYNEMLTARNWPLGAALSVVMLLLTTLAIRLYKRVTRGGSLSGMGGGLSR